MQWRENTWDQESKLKCLLFHQPHVWLCTMGFSEDLSFLLKIYQRSLLLLYVYIHGVCGRLTDRQLYMGKGQWTSSRNPFNSFTDQAQQLYLWGWLVPWYLSYLVCPSQLLIYHMGWIDQIWNAFLDNEWLHNMMAYIWIQENLTSHVTSVFLIPILSSHNVFPQRIMYSCKATPLNIVSKHILYTRAK